MSAVVNTSIGFGYPNIEELQLGVTTQLRIDDQIKIKLSYHIFLEQRMKAYQVLIMALVIKI